MQRLSSWALPIVLGVVGIALIIVGTIGPGDSPSPSLAPIATPTPVAVASPTPSASATASATPAASGSPSASATPTPLPDDVVATQLQIESVGINVRVRHSTSDETDSFPPDDAAYILQAGHEPGRNQNSYIFAHALNSLFKPLWNVQIGAEVLVQMSDGTVLTYVVTEVHPNVACPDENADPDLNPEAFGVEPPLALQIHEDCAEGQRWTADTPYERLTLQTSQGYNRNWGELVVIAKPAG